MLKPIALALAAALLFSMHAAAEEKETEEAPIVGVWLLSGMEVNGEAMEDDDVGRRLFVFAEDGSMQAFEDAEAYEAKKPDDVGWYERDDEGNLVFYEDRNENEKLDDDEKEAAESMAWSIEEDILTLSNTMGEGDKKVTFAVTLKPYQPKD